MNEIIDNYQEHIFHERPYWKNMKTCSECYKAHKESKLNIGRISSEDLGVMQIITRDINLENHYSREI